MARCWWDAMKCWLLPYCLMGTAMGEAAKMKILILIFPLAGMGLPSASPSAARITMKSSSRRGKIFRDHDLELQFTEARAGRRDWQRVPGPWIIFVKLLSDNGSVCIAWPFSLSLVSSFFSRFTKLHVDDTFMSGMEERSFVWLDSWLKCWSRRRKATGIKQGHAVVLGHRCQQKSLMGVVFSMDFLWTCVLPAFCSTITKL